MFSARVLAWFRRHGRRDLPWQQSPEPYRVWISEIMLQQTRVSTVIPYYLRFMEAFPRVADLAAAAEDEVLHHWSGLGYYARARNLHRAARQIMEHHGGRFPLEYKQVLALPGIGESTAGAILSLSHGQKHAILDGNVKRVLARVFMVEGWPGRASVQKELWRIARSLTPDTQVAAYNQAMMDLGATLCHRTRPDCTRCPLESFCAAHEQNRTGEFPGKKAARQMPWRDIQMLMICNAQGDVLLHKRPPAGIWGGLWSFPELEMSRQPEEWLQEKSLAAVSIRELEPRRHSFSHFHLRIHPRLILLKKAGCQVLDGDAEVWYNHRHERMRGLSAPVQQLLQELQRSST
ncbi:A/G-specific adenine glycosylase [Thiolapillus sp.]